jgi:hypothetical protein
MITYLIFFLMQQPARPLISCYWYLQEGNTFCINTVVEADACVCCGKRAREQWNELSAGRRDSENRVTGPANAVKKQQGACTAAQDFLEIHRQKRPGTLKPWKSTMFVSEQ